MPDENVNEEKKVVEGEAVEKNEEKKPTHPDSVSWTQYVGVKEKLGGEVTELKGQVDSLKEQLKKTSNPEELTRVKDELETTKTSLQLKTEELDTSTAKTLGEKRAALVKRGVSEDKVKEMSAKELDAVSAAVGNIKPAPDLGGGGGGSAARGSPLESARLAYS